MLQAMNTGHEGSMATIHANTPRDAISRLEQMIGMAGMPMTVGSIRGQIAAAIRVIVQLQRLSDGKRCVTSIAEITGLESDILQMQEIYKYVRTGTGDDGSVQGHFQATGVRPRFLADLVARGLDATDGLLVVIDGAKALAAAVREVFGANAAVQRCTLHKRRNVADHLPDKEKAWVDAKLVKAFGHPDPDQGMRAAVHLAGLLERTYPGAAASLREGLPEMFTVARLGITGALRRSLTNTNCIESMISTVRTVTGRVKTWHDGDMKKRWIATGMIEARRSFRRIRGHTQMTNLTTAIHHATNPVTPIQYAQDVA